MSLWVKSVSAISAPSGGPGVPASTPESHQRGDRARMGVVPAERWAWPLAGIALAALAAVVALADLGRLPGALQAVYAFPGGDKAGHVFVAALVALPLSLALRGQTVYLGRCSLPLAALLAGALLTMEELSQVGHALRTFSLFDLAASYLGICLATWASRRLPYGRRRTVPAPEDQEQQGVRR